MLFMVEWDNPKTFIRPEHALALIHYGFDSEKATLEGTSTSGMNEVLGKFYGNPEGPLLLFNQGGDIEIRSALMRVRENRGISHKTTLPTFGIYQLQCRDPKEVIWNVVTINTDDEKLHSYYSFSTTDTGLKTSNEERRWDYLDIFLRGKLNLDIQIWPYGTNEFPSSVVVPFMPIPERDPAYWKAISQKYGIKISEGKQDERDLTVYDCETKNPNVGSLRFCSNPQYAEGDLLIEAVFKNPVPGERFSEFKKFWRGMTEVDLDDHCVSVKGVTGRKLVAEIPKQRNYVATGLVGRICEV